METIKKIINWLGGSLTTENTKDWKVVVLCVIAATTFWFFNALNKNDYTTVIDYPIRFNFNNPNDSLIIVKSPPERIAIDVSGRGWILFRKTFWFNYEPIKIELSAPVDTKFLTRGSLLPIIEPQLSDLKVNYIVDDTLFINIERRISKKLKVFVDSLRIGLEDHHRITTQIRIRPDSVLIAGPKSIIDDLPARMELEIDEDDIDSEFNDRIDANVLELPLVTYYLEKVSVNFKVSEFVRKESRVPIEWIKFPDQPNLTVSDSTVNIDYMAVLENRGQINGSQFRVTADFSAISANDSTILLELEILSDHVTDVNFSPRSIKVSYGK